jgi:putative GTP pyrophosphokinase
MILERSNIFNFKEVAHELKRTIGEEHAEEFKSLMRYYRLCQSAVNEIGTKLENLNGEYQSEYNHNPIHHMEQRMKSVNSLFNKVKKKSLTPSIEAIEENIFDIGGIRVITNYISDVYTIQKNLLSQDDVTLIRVKDYIKNPKASGYRSVHLVVSVPVFLSTGPVETPVEIQIRTIGMDMWASLEHKLRYKTNVDAQKVEQFANQLSTDAEKMRA